MDTKLRPLILISSLLVVSALSGFIGNGSTFEGSIKVTVFLPPVVHISAPNEICSWEFRPLVPGIYTKKGVINVKSNTKWQVAVQSTKEVNDGHMTVWTGTSYAGKKLQAPLKVSADREVILPKDGIIQTGTTVGEHDIEVSLIQVVSQEDLPLENGHVYRIALSFEGSPME